jgi:chloramphenicol 3-O-phosphotransferase
MSRVIFLNGCVVAEKTTLAKEIQNLSEEKFLYVGIDALFGAILKKLVGFDERAEEGFWYVADPKTSVLNWNENQPLCYPSFFLSAKSSEITGWQ